jgi:hypothetical protein
VNKVAGNKVPKHRSIDNMSVKRNYLLVHKTMAKAIKKGMKMFIDTIDCIHNNSVLMEEKQISLFEKQL